MFATIVAVGIETGVVYCDRCDAVGNREVPEEISGWSRFAEDDFDICPDCHADFVDMGKDVIHKILMGNI